MAAKRSGSEGSSDDGGRRGQQQHWLRLRCDFVVVGGVGCSKGAAIILRDFRLPSKNGEGERFSVRASFSLRCFSQGKLIAFPYTCALLVLVLCLRLHLRSTLGMAASFLTERRAGSVGRFLLYDRSAVNSGMEGRWSLLRSMSPGVEGRCGTGGGFFSPRQLAVSRVRDAIDASGQTRHSASHTAPLGKLLQEDRYPRGISPSAKGKGSFEAHASYLRDAFDGVTKVIQLAEAKLGLGELSTGQEDAEA
ncbi:hypothetical protein GW17_00058796, partial [Ensete ventricosum]